MRFFCSICKDLFIASSEILVTNCGHLFHDSCISTWIKQHKTCPQCRAKTSHPFRVYFDAEADNDADPAALEHELGVISDKLREAEKEKKTLQEDYNNVRTIMNDLKECAMSLNTKNELLKTAMKSMQMQIGKLTRENESLTKLQSEITVYKDKIQSLERVEKMVTGTLDDANKLMASTPITELAVKQLCVFVGALKNRLLESEKNNSLLHEENKNIRKTLIEKEMNESHKEKIRNLEECNYKLEKELYQMKLLNEKLREKELKKKEERKLQINEVQTKPKTSKLKFDFDFDFDSDDEASTRSSYIKTLKESDTIAHWEKLVCEGRTRFAGLSTQADVLRKYPYKNGDPNPPRASDYAFDGLGGRKKIRLGGPTPREEFEKIKRMKNKKSVKAQDLQSNKIVDYFQID